MEARGCLERDGDEAKERVRERRGKRRTGQANKDILLNPSRVLCHRLTASVT
jgi:hypothetical protein